MDLKAIAGKPFLKRCLLWPTVALAAFAVLGFLVLPPIVKSVLVGQLSKKLHRSVAIRAIRINPFALSVKVEGFSMKDRDGAKPFISFEELYLNLEASSMVKGGPVLREISLRSPGVAIVRNEDSTYNFSDILDELTAGPPKEGEPLRYSLNNIVITGGSVDFDDRPRNTRHAVKDLSIGIPFLSNLPSAVNVYVHPAFEANVNGTAVSLKGMTKPYSPSRETSVDLTLRDLDIPHYLGYSPVPLGFRVLSGALDMMTVLTFAQPAGGPPAVALSGSVTLKNLSIVDLKGAQVLKLPSMSAGIASLEPLSRRAIMDNVVVEANEYPEYLKRAYREEKFPKPRNFMGMAKDLPVPEMEKLMYAHIQVTDDDLRLLAQKRARATRDYLVASKQVEPERVFLVEPRTPAPGKKEKQRDSRVEFVLK